jgi:uncharacterized protein
MTRRETEPFVEVGDPGYGPGMDPGENETARVDTEVEGIPWTPVTPPRPAAGELAFIDGVQQIEAWLTITEPGRPGVDTGLACAVAAGVVVAAPGRRARIAQTRVRRLVMATGDRALTLPSRGGFVWETRTGAGWESTALARQVGNARQELEHMLAESHAAPDRLLVLDGRLSSLRDTPGPVVGAVKSHQRMYLQPEAAEVVARLAVGQRTPLFAIGDDRLSWYQRLPVADARGWAGVLRGEVARSYGVARSRELADMAAAMLPGYAGREHRDPRAPQNLAPIAGLEQRLRHRLGDRRLALRAVRRPAAGARLDAVAVPVSVDDPGVEEAA